eukprot:CAMPEP_0184654894 /NCGR_PEP_ID=MMETSP0308-20130426/12544_1 /TAXON_ID=38269 /ORGANISM="Gloeochaete witrockiana, Strain SAG 46.84" /LENGTH=482 /DNA_ID=CAMNT_0027091089 /DNA_START=394 /DNA_END=1842 /DNA_ORIENTATION=+
MVRRVESRGGTRSQNNESAPSAVAQSDDQTDENKGNPLQQLLGNGDGEGGLLTIQEVPQSHLSRFPPRLPALVWTQLALSISLLVACTLWLKSSLQWFNRRVRRNQSWEHTFSEALFRPFQLLVAAQCIYTLASLVVLPLFKLSSLQKSLPPLRNLAAIVSVTWWILKLVALYQHREAERLDKPLTDSGAEKRDLQELERERKLQKAKTDAVAKLSTFGIIIVAVVASFNTLGVNLQAVLAFGGLGGVAIGLAGREIISNFFAGFMIYFTQSFGAGDWIQSIPDHALDGHVEEIGWYSTRIRSLDKRPIYVPNSIFSTLVIVNASRMWNRRMEETLRIRLQDIDRVQLIVTDIRKLLRHHKALDSSLPRLAFFSKITEHGLDIYVSGFSRTIILEEFLKVKQEILLQIARIIAVHGAELASGEKLILQPPSASTLPPFGQTDDMDHGVVTPDAETMMGSRNGRERMSPPPLSVSPLPAPEEI